MEPPSSSNTDKGVLTGQSEDPLSCYSIFYIQLFCSGMSFRCAPVHAVNMFNYL